MKQKCPKCGTWCDGEYLSFEQRAVVEMDKTNDKVEGWGRKIGGFFGKKGENFGGKIADVLSEATGYGLVKGLVGGVAGNQYYFSCPKCGFEWDAANDGEDNTNKAVVERQNLIQLIEECLQDKNFDSAIKKAQKLIDIDYAGGKYMLAASKRMKATYLKSLKKDVSDIADNESSKLFQSALNDINDSIDYYCSIDERDENEEIVLDWAFSEKGNILNEAGGMDNYANARKYYIRAMQTLDKSLQEQAIDCYRYVTQLLLQYNDQYTKLEEENKEILENSSLSQQEKEELIQHNRDICEQTKFCVHNSFANRQFIFFVKDDLNIAGCNDPDEIINWVFTLDQIPVELSFPNGHPQANTLYIAHPVKQGVYLPYEGAEEIIFHEKVEEFCRLAQCLGAREITFQSLKGENISEGLSSNFNINGGVGYSGLSSNGAYSKKQDTSSQTGRKKEIGYSYTFKPRCKPYVPSDLLWYDSDNSWHTFVKQRLEGNILTYTKRITSEETINITSNIVKSVKASFQYIMAQVDSSFDSEIDTTFSHNQNTEWEIKIEFESIDDIEVSNENKDVQKALPVVEKIETSSLTEDEEKYKEEVLFILEDGSISETERKFLERKRIKFGITPGRAEEIESMCTPSFTEAEKEYIELYKEIAADGPITERKRKMLAREADSLGICSQRAEELEKQF